MDNFMQQVHDKFHQTSGGIILPSQLLPFFKAFNDETIGSIVHEQEDVNK